MTSLLRLVTLCLVMVGDITHGFAPPARSQTPSSTITPTTKLFSILGDNNQGDETGNQNLSGFNPFDYKKTREADNSVYGFSGNQISLRKTRMQETMNDLLNVVDQPAETQAVLSAAADFLLEPLEDDNAVLDPDSIYTSQMSRSKRYQAYEESMQERLASARNPSVRKVLTTLRDFVLSHRDAE